VKEDREEERKERESLESDEILAARVKGPCSNVSDDEVAADRRRA